MKPEDQIPMFLSANKSKFEYSTLDLVVQDVKAKLYYGMSPISDDEIRKIVSKWASVWAAGLGLRPSTVGKSPSPTPGGSGQPSDSELIDAVKKAVATVNKGVTLGPKGSNINIGVKGLTANLNGGSDSLSLGLSWAGTLKVQAASGPFHFEGKLSSDEWEITLSFPKDTYIPDASTLGKVFTEGERAIGKMAEATRSFDRINDVGKVGAMIKPHTAALTSAMDAATGLANANKKGAPSFGFKLGSPTPMPGEKGMPSGEQGSVVFTWVF